MERAERMEERSRRIVATAVELAEEGGFEAVRLRDVATHAGVALGTLYRRFRSKEDLLVAALEQEAEDLERRIVARPPREPMPLERVATLFGAATRGLCRRPNLARAVLRAMTSGDPKLAEKVASFHDRITNLITLALRGAQDAGGHSGPPTERERRIAFVLQQVWFASLVGWSGGLHPQSTVTEQVQTAAELILGLAPEKSE